MRTALVVDLSDYVVSYCHILYQIRGLNPGRWWSLQIDNFIFKLDYKLRDDGKDKKICHAPGRDH